MPLVTLAHMLFPVDVSSRLDFQGQSLLSLGLYPSQHKGGGGGGSELYIDLVIKVEFKVKAFLAWGYTLPSTKGGGV